MTIREHFKRRSQWIFVLAMAGLLASLVPTFRPWWLDWVAHAWWAFWMLAVAAVIVVGERMTRCPRCGSKTDQNAEKCAGCGVSFEEPMPYDHT
jgi:DNA-directed RNA polymerase subunit RPC12/RpoP